MENYIFEDEFFEECFGGLQISPTDCQPLLDLRLLIINHKVLFPAAALHKRGN